MAPSCMNEAQSRLRLELEDFIVEMHTRWTMSLTDNADEPTGDLAAAFDAPLEAFDLGLHNWGSGKRTGAGLALDTEVDAEVLARAQDVLGL